MTAAGTNGAPTTSPTKPAYHKKPVYHKLHNIKTHFHLKKIFRGRHIINQTITIEHQLPPTNDHQKIQDILTNLTATSKKISSIYFYDHTGSKLFQQITQLPEYYLTRTEISLLHQAAAHLSTHLQNRDIIEFGSGDATKISILLDHIPKQHRHTIRYIPVDVSTTAINTSATQLAQRYPTLHIHGIVADFMTQLTVIPTDSQKLFCFLGSTIGNLSIPQAQHFLSHLSNIMHTDDLLLIGFDMVKNIKTLEKAYNDSQHITDQFNKNILNVINTHLNTNFNPDHFNHRSFYNHKESRIEMHLQATQDLEITTPHLPTTITLKKGETIHTENSYKFTTNHIHQLATHAHLDIQHHYTDDNNWFSLVQLHKP